MAEARQLAGFKLAVKPDGKIEIDWSSGNSENIWKYVNESIKCVEIDTLCLIIYSYTHAVLFSYL